MKKRGNKPGRLARLSDLQNLQKAQGKQTGPNTEDGKKVVSMNALKTGEFLKKYHRLSTKAGKLAACKRCGEEQQAICISKKNCELQDYFIASYFKSRDERNPDYIEAINIIQTANMELIFSTKLQYAIEHQDDVYKDPESGQEKHTINWYYISNLMNMYNSLGKNPEQMLLTRKTMDSSDAQWAQAGKEEIDRNIAKEYLDKLNSGFNQLIGISGKVDEKRKTDKDIQEYDDMINESGDPDDDLDIAKIEDSPFAIENRDSKQS